jgi:hypothetical protein
VDFYSTAGLVEARESARSFARVWHASGAFFVVTLGLSLWSARAEARVSEIDQPLLAFFADGTRGPRHVDSRHACSSPKRKGGTEPTLSRKRCAS